MAKNKFEKKFFNQNRKYYNQSWAPKSKYFPVSLYQDGMGGTVGKVVDFAIKLKKINKSLKNKSHFIRINMIFKPKVWVQKPIIYNFLFSQSII